MIKSRGCSVLQPSKSREFSNGQILRELLQGHIGRKKNLTDFQFVQHSKSLSCLEQVREGKPHVQLLLIEYPKGRGHFICFFPPDAPCSCNNVQKSESTQSLYIGDNVIFAFSLHAQVVLLGKFYLPQYPGVQQL